MKGIILAGWAGIRLYSLAMVTSKQLLPIYEELMIYCSLFTLMLKGIMNILLIFNLTDLPNFKRFLGYGSNYVVNLSHKIKLSADR